MSIRSHSLLPLLLALATFPCFCVAPAGAQTAPGPGVTEERLGPVPDQVVRRVTSADGCHVAMVANRGKRCLVVLDGVEGPEFDAVTGPDHETPDKDGPLFSADGKRLAYVGRREGTWIAVVDGVEGPPCDMIFKGGPRFSPDGSRVAYVAQSNADFHLVVDGVDGSAAGYVREYSLRFSPDGKRLSYVTCNPRGPGNNRMVVDGVTGPMHTWVGEARFSADSRRFAYTAVDREVRGVPPNTETIQEAMVYVDGAPRPAFVTTGDLGAVFSPDGKRIAYAGCTALHLFPRTPDGDRWRVVVDGAVGPEYTAIGNESPRFSGDSKRVAYAACTYLGHYRWSSQRMAAVVDGVVGPEYEIVGTPWFGPDGQHAYYVAVKSKKEGGKNSLVTDGVEGPWHDDVLMPACSPDGRRLAYVAVEGEKKTAKQHMVVDRVAGAEYTTVGAPVFSADGRRLAYRAQNPETGLVVLDGTPGPACDAVDDPVFSEDGTHLAYWARQGAKQRVVLDGAPGPEYDEVMRGGPAFRADGKLEFLAIQRGVLYRVTWSVPAKP
jgi:Tol biopolymer transport system component